MTDPETWDRHAILGALRRDHKTLAGIAKDYGLNISSVKNIWTRPNEAVERAIADVIGKPAEVLFKDRYPKRGNRLHIPHYSEQSPVRKPQRDAA